MTHTLVVTLLLILRRSTNLDSEQKMAKPEEQREHLMRSQEARIYMNDCISICKEQSDSLHLSFDFAQQVRTNVKRPATSLISLFIVDLN